MYGEQKRLFFFSILPQNTQTPPFFLSKAVARAVEKGSVRHLHRLLNVLLRRMLRLLRCLKRDPFCSTSVRVLAASIGVLLRAFLLRLKLLI
ncbi:dephospho-CoA kinase [Sesbania bispinosa]|nr:dephospho-CoA kinase [Sesbania bispinosa]